LDAADHAYAALMGERMVDGKMRARPACDLGRVPAHDLVDQKHRAAMGQQMFETVAGQHGVTSTTKGGALSQDKTILCCRRQARACRSGRRRAAGLPSNICRRSAASGTVGASSRAPRLAEIWPSAV